MMEQGCIREVQKRAKSEKTTRTLFKDSGEFLRVENEDIEEVLQHNSEKRVFFIKLLYSPKSCHKI